MGGFGSGADVHVSIHTIFTWYFVMVTGIVQDEDFQSISLVTNLLNLNAAYYIRFLPTLQ